MIYKFHSTLRTINVNDNRLAIISPNRDRNLLSIEMESRRAFQMMWEGKLFTHSLRTLSYVLLRNRCITMNNISWRLSLSWRNFTSFRRESLAIQDAVDEVTKTYTRDGLTANFCDDVQRRQTFWITVGDS